MGIEFMDKTLILGGLKTAEEDRLRQTESEGPRHCQRPNVQTLMVSE